MRSTTAKRRLLDHLASVPVFAPCSRQELEVVLRHAEEVSVEPGEVLAREGRVGRELFIIVAGQATVRRSGREVAKLVAGDYFGELALLDPAPRNATVTADTPLEVLIIGPREIGVILDEVPELRDALLHGMARRLREADASADATPVGTRSGPAEPRA